ncbi:hypothetical protein EUGRSUZ_C02004 [Eucalyptus grandis]|uniref:Uncharacterized protein n=2 Tax=Eucalyptus grandis TaxID=71139 RepID=A0ACC3LG82_EUCGR|nr:hypothetical protein EUGRSUZ_C02004 [Eucalyptus grandis]
MSPLLYGSNNSNPTTISVNVGVILDLETEVGQMGLTCINMSLSDFYSSNPSYKTRLVLNVRDSKRDEVAAAAGALDLIKNKQVQAIIGPQGSAQADFLIHLGNKLHVPIISFSATSPSLSSIRSPYFIRAAQNDSSQVNAVSAVVQAFGWREAVLVYIDNEFAEGIIPSLTDALEKVNTRVPYRSLIHPLATDDQILRELYKLMTMQTRVFIVHMLPTLGYRLFAKVKEVGMMSEGYVWIMTNGITDLWRSVDSSVVANSMQGVLGIKTHVPSTRNLHDFMLRWKMKFQQDNPSILNPILNIFGYWAYDAAWALAMAVEEMGAANFTFQTLNASTDVIDVDTFRVSQNGQKLLQNLANMTFVGLTGYFSLVNGQLESSVFQIVNINGNAARGIGFWTLENGLLRDLNSFNTSKYSTFKGNLAPIIWPGDSTSIPKGWEIPVNGKRLRILVPAKEGFNQFVKVTRDPRMNTSLVTGYYIDIFQAVIEKLPYAVPYDFFPFALPNGSSAGSYNDMIDQVFYQNYDAVVGDTTIIVNRSLYVDFTLPYTESRNALLVFPKGSQLVPDISRALLNVTEGPKMTEIENTWFTSKTNCPNSTTSVSSNSLGLDSFLGLFFIAGAAAVLALLIFMVMFVKRNWHEVTGSSSSSWEKIVALGRRFYQRDLNSYTFRKGRFRDKSIYDGGNEIAAVVTLENTSFPPSPSSDSSQSNDVLTNKQGTPSPEVGFPNPVDKGGLGIAINAELTIQK